MSTYGTGLYGLARYGAPEPVRGHASLADTGLVAASLGDAAGAASVVADRRVEAAAVGDGG